MSIVEQVSLLHESVHCDTNLCIVGEFVLHCMPSVMRQVYALWGSFVLCWGLYLALWGMTLLCNGCTLCGGMGFVGHTLSVCYYPVHHMVSLWVEGVSTL